MVCPKEPVEDQLRRRLIRKSSIKVDSLPTLKIAKSNKIVVEAVNIKLPAKRAADVEELEIPPSKRQRVRVPMKCEACILLTFERSRIRMKHCRRRLSSSQYQRSFPGSKSLVQKYDSLKSV